MAEMQSKKHILVALVENKPGVLNRVANLFRRRNFNIDSLNVGRTHRSYISRLTVVVDATRGDAHRIAANLLKLINVIDVATVSNEQSTVRTMIVSVQVGQPSPCPSSPRKPKKAMLILLAPSH